MVDVVDCVENTVVPAVTPAQNRKCSEYVIKDITQNVTLSTPVNLADQNGHTMVSGFLTADQILTISMVPDLDFEKSLGDFSDQTYTDISALGTAPERWQRPLKFKRERDIRDYFLTSAAGSIREVQSLIPGAVILGEREVYQGTNNIEVKIEGTISSVDYHSINIEYNLLNSCVCGHTEPAPAGGITYFDRCPDHNCTSGQHNVSVAPFQIIDGQHRVLGIKRLSGDESMPVVFLLFDRASEPDKPAILGTDAPAQAEIFEKTNNKAKGLNKLHSFWINRLLDPSSLDAAEVEAFDLLADLGRNSGGAANKWRGKVQFHPRPSAQPFIASDRGAKEGSGMSGAVRIALPDLDTFSTDVSVGSPTQNFQLQCFIRGAMDDHISGGVTTAAEAKSMFGGAGPSPFRGKRLFEVIIRHYKHIADRAKDLDGALDHGAFVKAWNLQGDSFASTYAPTWNNYRASGEPPREEFENLWELMWGQPWVTLPRGGGFAPPDTAPTWETVLGAAGSCADWGEYAGLVPDPITLTSSGTRHVSGGSLGSARGATPMTVTAVPNSFTIDWNAPRNILASRAPLVQVRVSDGAGGWEGWVAIDSSTWTGPGPTTASVDMSGYGLSTGDLFQVQIEYRNLNGAETCQLEYEIS